MNFSVLLSLYKKEKPDYLRQSLESIFNQTLSPTEVVLVLDGPITNELIEVVNLYKSNHIQLNIVPLKENVGLGPALNEGLRCCSYDLVIRMDTDDICYPNRFEEQVSFMVDHPDIDLCSSWIDEFINNDTDKIVSQRKLPENHNELFSYGKFRCPVNHPATIYRKTSVLKVGGYIPSCQEDYYLWARMLVNGAKFHCLQKPLLLFRLSSDVYKRRGGLKYAKSERDLFLAFHKIGYTNFMETYYNIVCHTAVRMMPNSIRSLIYKTLLRK